VRILVRLVLDTLYLLSGLPLALAGFLVALHGVVVGVGAVVVVGLPILGASMYLLRRFADLERRRIRGVLGGAPVARPVYKSAPPGAGLLRRLLLPLLDVQAWLDLLHPVIALALSALTVAVVLGWWAVAVGASLLWAYGWALGVSWWQVVLGTAIGLAFLVSLAFVARKCALGQATLGRILLAGVAEIEERRRAAVSAEAVALRKLERDIHDGPQQRLVRLAVDLGRAQHLFETDPLAARRVVEQALNQTEETLDELRALSRGIAPPILADRGLAAAVAAVAARCTIPVSLSCADFPRPDPAVETAVSLSCADFPRPDPAVETAAYFVVAEALANAAKHSGASSCSVRLERQGNRLVVTVTDNGRGAAHVAKGHGLAGLTDRARAVGGLLTVDSPQGGPTTVTADLPWH
jgi:signal transduction histidine kinase